LHQESTESATENSSPYSQNYTSSQHSQSDTLTMLFIRDDKMTSHFHIQIL